MAKRRFLTRNLVKVPCFHGPSPTRSSGGGLAKENTSFFARSGRNSRVFPVERPCARAGFGAGQLAR